MVKDIPEPKFKPIDGEPATFEEICAGNDTPYTVDLITKVSKRHIAFYNGATLHIPHLDITMQLGSDDDGDETVYLMKGDREITTTGYSDIEESQQSLDNAVEDLEGIGYTIIRI